MPLGLCFNEAPADNFFSSDSGPVQTGSLHTKETFSPQDTKARRGFSFPSSKLGSNVAVGLVEGVMGRESVWECELALYRLEAWDTNKSRDFATRAIRTKAKAQGD